LEGHPSPNFLYTSGKPNRYNSAGVQCVYFAEKLEIAVLEYERQMAGLPAARQPFIVFRANVGLPVLDLTDPATVSALALSPQDLYAPWRRSTKPTQTQLLGEAIARQTRFAAIRYPSAAAKSIGSDGCGIAIFQNSVRSPSFVRIIGSTPTPLAEWP